MQQMDESFNALGISKEMLGFKTEYHPSELTRLMDSSYFECPCIKKRQAGQVYVTIEITGCQHQDWWYKDLIGIQLFCEVRFHDHKQRERIKEFIGTRLTSTKQIIFRSVWPKDAIII